MSGPITWEAVAYFVALIVPVLAISWQVQQRITTLKERVEQVRAHGARDLDAFKLEVARDFVRPEMLDKIERRQIESETRVTDALLGLTQRIDALLSRSPNNSPHS